MISPGRVAFSIFGIDIMWYGVLISIGMLIACAISYRRAPSHNIRQDDLIDVLLISLPMGVIGARIYYVIFNWDYYGGDLTAIVNIRNGGLAIHGGLLLGFVTAIIFCHVKKISPLNLLDLTVPSIALAQAIGRWGNFFNEEAHGGITDFPINVLINGQTYHATFLYESIWCIMLFLALSKIDKDRIFTGQVFLLYAILYSVERFFVEALRTDSLMIGTFKQAQVLSLSVIIVSIICYIILAKREKKKNKMQV